MKECSSEPRAAFSLVELLVVIGLMALLVGLLLPAIQRVRGSADKLACAANLHQVGLALHHYHQDYGGFPPRTFDIRFVDSELSWRALLMPYIEQDSLWAQTQQARRLDPDPTHAPPHNGFAVAIKVFVCPTDARLLRPLVNADGLVAGYTSYVGVAGALSMDGILPLPAARLADITDGTSHTIMVGERPPPDDLRAGQWYPVYTRAPKGMWFGPSASMLAILAYSDGFPCGGSGEPAFGPGRSDNPCDSFHFWSLHQRGGHFLFGDASIRFLRYEARSLLPALATRAGGEVVQLDE